jgi:RNase P subunit RPR2
MKATRNYEKLTIDVEATTHTELFEALHQVDEVFGEEKCGKCGSLEVKFRVREDKEENKYYELHCNSCFAKKMFGQHKKGGTLFPKRTQEINGEDAYLPTGGWVIYSKEKGYYE